MINVSATLIFIQDSTLGSAEMAQQLEPQLLLQRTQIQFPEPTIRSTQAPRTSVLKNPVPYSGFHIHMVYTNSYTYTSSKEFFFSYNFVL